MSEENKKSETTCQEGVSPIQFFRSPAIPVTPEMKLSPRLGRPERSATDDDNLASEKPEQTDKSR